MLSKSDYSKLSPAGKARLKKSMGAKPKKGRASSARVYGRGDYWSVEPANIFKGESPFRKTKSARDALGAQVGGALFGKTGRAIGGGLHAAFKAITGFGDYKVSSNSLMAGTGAPPVFSTGGRKTMIQHREYLGDILSSTGFAIQSFPINAGMAFTFPWASTLANQFEQYCLRGCLFQFRSTSAASLTSGTSTAMGSVLMATSYDSVSPIFTTEAQMLNHEFSGSVVPSKDLWHPIECAPRESTVNCFYTRNTTPPTGADKRLYDVGNFCIATIGQQHAGDVIGQLWVTYDIEVLKPQLGQNGQSAITGLSDHYRLNSVSATNPFGTTGSIVGTQRAGSNAGTTLLGGSTPQVTFPISIFPKTYIVDYMARFTTAGVNSSFAVATLGGAIVDVSSTYFLQSGGYTETAVTDNNIYSKFAFQVPATAIPLGVLFTTMTVGATGGIGADLFVHCLPSNLLTSEHKVSANFLPVSAKGNSAAVTEEAKYADTVSRRVLTNESKEDDIEESQEDDFKDYLAFMAYKKSASAIATPTGLVAGVTSPIMHTSEPPPKTPSRK